MSIEYFGAPTPILANNDVESLLQVIGKDLQMTVVRQSQFEVGLAFCPDENQEAVTIVVKPEQVYVGFHNATRDQRATVLTKLQMFLESSGRECSFEEE
jgi:hypothetical protein